MIINISFDLLDAYLAVYGGFLSSEKQLKIYVEGGLGVGPECRDLFPRRYFYDPWTRNKFSECKIDNDLVEARVEGTGELVKYFDKTISKEILKYEYVGGCWFVFEEVFSAKKNTFGNAFIEDGVMYLKGSNFQNLEVEDSPDSSEYVLEGSLSDSLGGGHVSWQIHAKSFYLEI